MSKDHSDLSEYPVVWWEGGSDQCWYARSRTHPGVTAHGPDPAAALSELVLALEGCLEHALKGEAAACSEAVMARTEASMERFARLMVGIFSKPQRER